MPKNPIDRTKVEALPAASDELSIAQSVIPYNYDTHKARFLAYRACGFKPREAMRMVGIRASSVSEWRSLDQLFVDTENNLPNIRKRLSEEFVNLEFLRNYTLILKKDYDVINKSVFMKDGLSNQEHQYLLRARAHYTPQQMEVIKALAGEQSGQGFDFTKIIIQAAKAAQKSGVETLKLELSR